MEITFEELKEAFPALQKLSVERFPPKTALHVARLVKEAAGELNILEEQRVRLVKQYGTEDEHGNWSVPNEKFGEFSEEYGRHLSEQAEIGQPPLPFRSLPATLMLTPADMLALTPLLEMESE